MMGTNVYKRLTKLEMLDTTHKNQNVSKIYILPPVSRQKALSRKLRRNTSITNGHFVFPTIPGTPKPKMVRCHFRKNSNCHFLSFMIKTSDLI